MSPVQIRVELEGADDVIERLQSIHEVPTDESFAEEAEQTILAAMIANAPFREYPPNDREVNEHRHLKDSMSASHTVDEDGMEIRITTDDGDVATWVIGGTRPHPISAHDLARPILAWLGAGGITFVSTKNKPVKHPGTRANPFNARAWDSVSRDVIEDFISKIRERLAG